MWADFWHLRTKNLTRVTKDVQPSGQDPVSAPFPGGILCSLLRSHAPLCTAPYGQIHTRKWGELLATCLVYNIKIKNFLIGHIVFFEKTSFSISTYSSFSQGNAEWNLAITFTDPQGSTLVITHQCWSVALCDRRGLIQIKANASQDSWHSQVFMSILRGWTVPEVFTIFRSQFLKGKAPEFLNYSWPRVALFSRSICNSYFYNQEWSLSYRCRKQTYDY